MLFPVFYDMQHCIVAPFCQCMDNLSATCAAYLERLCASVHLLCFCPCLPQRFAVNPRTFIVQSVSAAASVLRTLLSTFNEMEQLTDGDNNNDIAAITAFVEGTRDTLRWGL